MDGSTQGDALLSAPDTYDAFAYAYELYWEPVSLGWLRWLSLMIAPRLKARSRVLDLCCGTGVIAAELSRLGFRVVGLDGSIEMLRYARSNAADVPLLQADVRQFGARARFDAAICIFDSLNHLLSAEDLRAAFSCVQACLRPGGWFFFDVNTEHGYLLHWSGRYEMRGKDHVVLTRSRYVKRRRLGVFEADISRFRGGERTDSHAVLRQRCHSPGEIVQALEDAGLRLVETYGLEQGELVAGSMDCVERAFYVCQRPRRKSSPGVP